MKNIAQAPTVLVVLGATGDLMKRKIAPAMWHLWEDGKLPQMFRVVGFSFDDMSDEQFRAHVSDILDSHSDIEPTSKQREEFLNFFSFQTGKFEQLADYENLEKHLKKIDDSVGLCTNKLFYLAVPPPFYRNIFTNLDASDLTEPCDPENGWTRVLVEKPFGNDLKTAQELDVMLDELFREEQIYRIDHYLAKDMVRNVLAWRFSNNLLEQSWSAEHIERIDLNVWETVGVEGRGEFYDGIGALRDVGQNHLMQMLALTTMDGPKDFTADEIRKERVAVLEQLQVYDREGVASNTARAQYDGYGDIEGVKAGSQTETFFKLRAWIDSERWQGVPLYLESGKRLVEPSKEIRVTFKHTEPCLCPGEEHYQNIVTFRLEPEEGISIEFFSKKPGLTMDIEKRELKFTLRDEDHAERAVEPYEKVLLDCIAGDQTLFVSSEEVKAMWRFIDPIEEAWHDGVTELLGYTPDSDEIISKELLEHE